MPDIPELIVVQGDCIVSTELEIRSEDDCTTHKHEPSQLKCPRCGAVGVEVIEQDTAIRWNHAQPEITDGVLVLAYGLGDIDFQHDAYLCGACQEPVALPAQFDPEHIAEDWS